MALEPPPFTSSSFGQAAVYSNGHRHVSRQIQPHRRRRREASELAATMRYLLSWEIWSDILAYLAPTLACERLSNCRHCLYHSCFGCSCPHHSDESIWDSTFMAARWNESKWQYDAYRRERESAPTPVSHLSRVVFLLTLNDQFVSNAFNSQIYKIYKI